MKIEDKTYVVECPECRSNEIMGESMQETLAFYPNILVDGVYVNGNKNIMTTCYSCLICGNKFEIKIKEKP